MSHRENVKLKTFHNFYVKLIQLYRENGFLFYLAPSIPLGWRLKSEKESPWWRIDKMINWFIAKSVNASWDNGIFSPWEFLCWCCTNIKNTSNAGVHEPTQKKRPSERMPINKVLAVVANISYAIVWECENAKPPISINYREWNAVAMWFRCLLYFLVSYHTNHFHHYWL